MRGLKKIAVLGISMMMTLAVFAAMPSRAGDTDAGDVTGDITITAHIPHISYIDLWTAGPTTALNQYVDVDDGLGTWSYRLEVNGYYSMTAAEIDVVDAYLWWDGGATGADQSANIGGLLGPNQGVHFQWDRNALPGSNFQILSGLTVGDEEWVLGPEGIGGCEFLEAGNNFQCYFQFFPMEQVWAAKGVMTETPATGYRYDGDTSGAWNSEDQMDNVGPVFEALNDADTWDMMATVADSDPVPAALSFPSWDEFGIYYYTAMTTAGLPNTGDVSGVGAPGTLIDMPNGDGDWTFKANAPYDLSVEITNLVNGVDSIGAAAILFTGGENAGPGFSGPNTRMYLLGDSLVGTAETPRTSARTTDTTTGAGDGTGVGGGPASWACNCPAIPEKVYTGTITYHLDLDP